VVLSWVTMADNYSARGNFQLDFIIDCPGFHPATLPVELIRALVFMPILDRR